MISWRIKAFPLYEPASEVFAVTQFLNQSQDLPCVSAHKKTLTLENIYFSCTATVPGSGWRNMDRGLSKWSSLQLLLLAVTSRSASVHFKYTVPYSVEQQNFIVSLTGVRLPICLASPFCLGAIAQVFRLYFPYFTERLLESLLTIKGSHLCSNLDRVSFCCKPIAFKSL